MTNTPTGAALDLIQAAKQGDVPAADAIAQHTTDLDRDELESVLRLLFPFLAELYQCKGAGEVFLAARTREAFESMVQTLGGPSNE